VEGSDAEASAWLASLVSGSDGLSRFLSFRADSVARLAAELAEEARRLGRKVSLDLFSPCLAPLVGQSYRRHCHAATDLRSFWSPGSQRDGEDQLRWIPVPARDH
jgi:hypothetical protein